MARMRSFLALTGTLPRACYASTWFLHVSNTSRSFSTSPETTGKAEKKVKKKPSGSEGQLNQERKGEAEHEKRLVESFQGFIEAAESAKKFKIEYTAEELNAQKAIGREYSRQIRIRTNQEHKDYANKIWLQQEAMRALPDELRAAAEEIDETPPPVGRPWPVWMTPPIKGFDVKQYTMKKNKDGSSADDDDESDVMGSKKI